MLGSPPRLRPGETGSQNGTYMKKYSIYLLLSEKDRKTYLGSTDSIKRRVEEHNKGLCRSTKYGRPLKLIYYENYETLQEARLRERYLKTTSGRRELKNLFNRE